MTRIITLLLSHGVAIAAGFVLGIYLLPILTAPPAPDDAMLESKAQAALYTATLTRELAGSDFAHWGEGTVSVTPSEIIHQGKLAPGPDYRLYLVREFIETEEQFLAIKNEAAEVGDVRTFSGFALSVPDDVDISDYNSIVVWCEAFSEFITAAQYR